MDVRREEMSKTVGQSDRLFLKRRACVRGRCFQDRLPHLIVDPIDEAEANAVEQLQPDRDGKNIVVARCGSESHLALNYRKDQVLLLQREHRRAERTEELAAGNLQNVEVTG